MAIMERAVELGPQDVEIDRRANGIIYARSPHAIGPVPGDVTSLLEHWARETPEQTFVARRAADGGWRTLSYGRFYDRMRGICAALLARDVSAERPVAILSGNSIEHLLLSLACMHIGVPFAPISTAYSLVSSDYGKLRYILDALTPGLVFADDAAAFGKAMAATRRADAEYVTLAGGGEIGATAFADLDAHAPDAVAAAHEKVDHDTIAKILFTSGSTGMPKGVINTQRMMCSNIAQGAFAMAEIARAPQVLIDWLPWNHTFGGNQNVSIALYSGGSLYIDDGKPTPAGFEETIRNLKEIAPTCYFNVPKGFEFLAHRMKDDAQLRATFFSRVRFLMYAGASLPQHVWDALENLALETVGEKIRIVTGLGATETAPSISFVTRGKVRAGMIGNPVPGCEIKLVPNVGKLELRVRGPNVTPGYWRAPEATAAAFDEEGFYKMGDAVRFVDPNDPHGGFMFDGRVSEDFKLATGTWVGVGNLRTAMIAAFAPFLRDAVIAGHDRDDVTAILLLDPDGCRLKFADIKDTSPAALAAHSGLREALGARLRAFAAAATGSSTRVARAVILDEHPSIDHGEVTDKGSINQRAALAHRASLVKELYGETASNRIISAD
ncbi:MAG: feruloyl-CoA synthase [Hyphomicrobiales bacterium]|nr:feruloyl-CoA synthase [Hyphomicrobiales bacterium]